MGLAFLINRDRFQMASDQKIIREEDYLTMLEAQALIFEAERESQVILQSAREAYEQHCDQGYGEGVQKGKQEMAEAIADVAVNAGKTMKELEGKIVNTVMSALNSILQKEDSTQLFKQALRKVAKSVREEAFLSLKVSPDEAEEARLAIESITAEFAMVKLVDIVPDSTLSHGDCIIESPSGVVDARLETQLRIIRQSLVKAFEAQGLTT
jgi:type III secretion protein L